MILMVTQCLRLWKVLVRAALVGVVLAPLATSPARAGNEEAVRRCQELMPAFVKAPSRLDIAVEDKGLGEATGVRLTWPRSGGGADEWIVCWYLPRHAESDPWQMTQLDTSKYGMRFGGLVAIDDVSFAAPPAQITAIIGPNGAGKTTVFNCLTGFYKPSVGRLTLNAAHGTFLLEQLDGFRIGQKARVARTFQNIRLFAGMCARRSATIPRARGWRGPTTTPTCWRWGRV